MRKLTALAGVAALGLTGQAFGYSASGTVTFSWGGNSGGTANAGSPYGATVDTTADIAWTSNGTNSISSIANSTYFTTLSGYNSRSYYDPDYASAAQCTAGSDVPPTGTNITRRKYGCRYTTASSTNTFVATPVTDQKAALNGGSATGSITVTDTTLTGTLTINANSDEPTGATTTFSSTGARLSNSPGNGFSGYNYRSADGSPFGNYWQGITTAGTLELNLTGTFTNGSWSITGGTVKFTDAGFACQQGGLGSTIDPAAGTLCTRSSTAGGQQYNGAHLSWGWDLDGAATGTTAITTIDIRDGGGTTTLSTISGVLASVTISGGTVSTTSGEFRRALGSAGGGCANHLRYDGTKISCGTLTTGLLAITGTVTESSAVPVPAAVWLMGSALGLLGWIRRRASA